MENISHKVYSERGFKSADKNTSFLCGQVKL